MNVAAIARAAIAGILAAAGAAVTGGDGADLANLDIGQWLTVIGTGLVAAGALLTPKNKGAAGDKAVTSVSDVLANTDKLAQRAVEAIAMVRDAVGELPTVHPATVVNNVPATPPPPPDAVWQRPLGELGQRVLGD